MTTDTLNATAPNTRFSSVRCKIPAGSSHVVLTNQELTPHHPVSAQLLGNADDYPDASLTSIRHLSPVNGAVFVFGDSNAKCDTYVEVCARVNGGLLPTLAL